MSDRETTPRSVAWLYLRDAAAQDKKAPAPLRRDRGKSER